MATAVFSVHAISGARALPVSGKNSGLCCSSRLQGLCLHSQPISLRRQAICYGFTPRTSSKSRLRTCALAEQQQQQAEIEQAEDGSSSDVVVDNAEADGANAKASEAAAVSRTSVLLNSFREAVLVNDQDVMSSIESQLEDMERESSSMSQLVGSLTEEASVSKERLLRLNADFDNYRKRSEREKQALRENVKGDVIESLLPMIDNFERAKSAIKAETEGEKKIDSSYQSIYKQFVDIMKSLGVKVIDTVGKEFNPEIHEAIMREESAEFEEGFVIQEFRRGFMMGDKLLRPAMVKVSSGKSLEQADATQTDAAADADSATAAAQEGDETAS